MANANEFVNDFLFENKLVEMWPEYPYLYDVRSPEFKNRDLPQQPMQEMVDNLRQTGVYLYG